MAEARLIPQSASTLRLSFTGPDVREMERASIRDFVTRHRHLLEGRVLDFGAGKPGTCRQPQPYRDLVSGDYIPIDKGDSWPSGQFDAVLCTQVMQYLEEPLGTLISFLESLKRGGHLVMTYPTNWPECESDDLDRFPRVKMDRLLKLAGFEILVQERRASIVINGEEWAVGYGVVARRP